MIESEVARKIDLGRPFLHAGEAELKKLVRESLTLLDHATNVRTVVLLDFAVVLLNFGETRLTLQRSIFVR